MGYLDLNEGLSYEKIIQRYLFDDRRSIVNLKLFEYKVGGEYDKGI